MGICWKVTKRTSTPISYRTRAQSSRLWAVKDCEETLEQEVKTSERARKDIQCNHEQLQIQLADLKVEFEKLKRDNLLLSWSADHSSTSATGEQSSHGGPIAGSVRAARDINYRMYLVNDASS